MALPFFEISIYIISGSVCLTMAFILLFVKSFISHKSVVSYQRIKSFLAYSALVDVFTDTLAVSLLLQNTTIRSLDVLVIPIAYSVQLILITRALLGLIHASYHVKRIIKYSIIPLPIICAVYLFGILSNVINNDGQTIQLFQNFQQSTLCTLLHWITNIYCVFCFCICMYILIKETKKYINKVDNYYSGEQAIIVKQISNISFCFVGYFLLAGIDFLLDIESVHFVIFMINTILFIYFTIIILNLQLVYINTNEMGQYEINYGESSLTLIDNDGTSSNTVTSQSADGKEVYVKAEDMESSILYAIRTWEKRSDKPFIKDGLMIADVASELKITDVQLSFILNHSLKMNFNSWINYLRIEESKNIMKKDSQVQLSKIAYMSGFADQSSFSKSFKKIVGMSPSNYRKTISE